jgi:DnaJ-class molecular chaperone
VFTDYYSILAVDYNASSDEIKKAYRKQSIKWHPDKNIGRDTTRKMEQINEAYLILGDPEARKRYDKEYALLEEVYSDRQEDDINYDIQDDVLSDWINKAREQSINLAKQTVQDISGLTKQSMRAAFDSVKHLVVLLILLLIASFTYIGFLSN